MTAAGIPRRDTIPQVVFFPNRGAVIPGDTLAHDINRRYELDDLDLAHRVAAIVAQEVERVGRSDARPVMTCEEDGDTFGPYCSWCWQLWPLCGHAQFSEIQ